MNPAFKITALHLSMTTICILQCDWHAFQVQMENMLKQAPRFFEKTPVILDATAVKSEIQTESIRSLVHSLKDLGVHIIGVRGYDASSIGLPNISTGRVWTDPASMTSEPGHKQPARTTPHSQEPQSTSSRSHIIQDPVRSGQSIHVKCADLIVVNSVNAGAEVMADGHIHVYGKIMGRALAGISGDTEAHIFCHEFRQAELIAIAGLYMMQEDFERFRDMKGPYRIYLKRQLLHIDSLSD